MKLLSIDVGMKNLAFALFDCNDGVKLLKWDVVSIVEEKKYTCQAIEKNAMCNKPAKFFKEDKYYCKKHAKNQDFIIPSADKNVKKIKKMKLTQLYEFADNNNITYNKPIAKNVLLEMIINHIEKNYFQQLVEVKCNDIDLITLGRNMRTKFDMIFSCDCIDMTHIIIENQISPIANRMKTLQGMIAQYFIMKTNAKIEFISASNKLKELCEKDTTYDQRKKKGIEFCTDILEQNTLLTSWIDLLKTNKKKDDLADCFLQGWWYIKK